MPYFRHPPPWAQAHLKQIDRRILAIGHEALSRSAALYFEPRRGKLAFLASAVLLGVGTSRFLVTAGHVLDEALGKPLYAGGKNGLNQISGHWVHSRAPSAGRDSDHIDIALLRLEENIAKRLDLKCVPAEETDDSFQPDPRRGIGTYYVWVGFPKGLQSIWLEGGMLNAPKQRYWAMKPGPAPETFGEPYNKMDNLVLGFDKVSVKLNGEMVTAPDPVGMSGGGIWACNGLISPRPSAPRLVGISTTWLRKRDAIIATRIGHCLNVAEHFDEIPAS